MQLRKNSNGSMTDLISKNLNPESSEPPDLPEREDMMTTPTPRGEMSPIANIPGGVGEAAVSRRLSGAEVSRDLPPQTQQVRMCVSSILLLYSEKLSTQTTPKVGSPKLDHFIKLYCQ